MHPMAIRYNRVFNELCVATKSDVRVIDIGCGQTRKIIANIVREEEGEQCDIT